MKKLISITAILILSSGFSFAQLTSEDNLDKFHIGAKIGGSFSNVYDTSGEEFDADPIMGLTGGVFFSIPIGRFIDIQVEGMITQKGLKGSGSILGSQYSFQRRTTFLEIPFLLGIKASQYVTVLVGPQYSYLLKERYEFSSAVVNILQEEEFKQDNIRKNIFGIVGGIDVNLSQIVVGARIGWDLVNNRGDGTSSTPRYKNVCAQLTVGFRF